MLLPAMRCAGPGSDCATGDEHANRGLVKGRHNYDPPELATLALR